MQLLPRRFRASVYRQHFPVELRVTGTSSHQILFDQPGHVITLVPPLRIENLLPVDLTYNMKEYDVTGNVKPGKIASVVSVSEERHVNKNYYFSLQYFPLSGRLWTELQHGHLHRELPV